MYLSLEKRGVIKYRVSYFFTLITAAWLLLSRLLNSPGKSDPPTAVLTGIVFISTLVFLLFAIYDHIEREKRKLLFRISAVFITLQYAYTIVALAFPQFNHSCFECGIVSNLIYALTVIAIFSTKFSPTRKSGFSSAVLVFMLAAVLPGIILSVLHRLSVVIPYTGLEETVSNYALAGDLSMAVRFLVRFMSYAYLVVAALFIAQSIRLMILRGLNKGGLAASVLSAAAIAFIIVISNRHEVFTMNVLEMAGVKMMMPIVGYYVLFALIAVLSVYRFLAVDEEGVLLLAMILFLAVGVRPVDATSLIPRLLIILSFYMI